MTDITNIQWSAMSDAAILKSIGEFIKQNRIEQNKTQAQLAFEAGINRATLSQVENGSKSNLLTFIQILRTLDLLYLFKDFQLKQQISPLQLAKLEQSKRKRAKKSNTKNTELKSNW